MKPSISSNFSPKLGKKPGGSDLLQGVSVSSQPKWAVGVTTCDRSEPTLERTVDSLIRAGWNGIDVFCDGPVGNSLPKDFFSGSESRREAVRVHDRPQRIGAYGNFVCALTELVQSHADCNLFFMVQDDTIFCRNLREYIEKSIADPTLSKDGVVFSAYCSGTDYDDFNKRRDLSPGWKRTDRGWGMMGALTVVFTLKDALSFLSTPSTWLHRFTLKDKSTKQVDAEIGKWAKSVGKKAMFHHPSLAQHIGETSSIYKLTEMSDRRSSPTFVSESFDALAFLKKEEKTVVRQTFGDSPSKAKNWSVFGSLGLNSTGYATARLLDIERIGSVLCSLDPEFPVAGGSFEQPISFCPAATNRSKIEAGLRKAEIVFATKPMPNAVLSYCKTYDCRIVSLLFDWPFGLTTAWTNTLRSSDLIISPNATEEAIEQAKTKGWNVTNWFPDVLSARYFDVVAGKRGYWCCGPAWKDSVLQAAAYDGPKIIFSNCAKSVKERLSELFTKVPVLDLTKIDHEEFCDELQTLSDLSMPNQSLNWFALPIAEGSPVRFRNSVSSADFPAFLKEKMVRFHA